MDGGLESFLQNVNVELRVYPSVLGENNLFFKLAVAEASPGHQLLVIFHSGTNQMLQVSRLTSHPPHLTREPSSPLLDVGLI